MASPGWSEDNMFCTWAMVFQGADGEVPLFESEPPAESI
jgi:hypothetical protein